MASQIAETYGSVQRISEEILDFGIAIAEAQQLKRAMDAELSHLRGELSGKQQRSLSLERLKAVSYTHLDMPEATEAGTRDFRLTSPSW